MGKGKDGVYRSGIFNNAFLTDLGFFLTIWPQVEEMMVVIFADLTGVDDMSSARLIFRSIINQNTRIAIMRAMLEKAPQHKDRSQFFDDLIDEFSRLNRLRNTYAHGLWYTHHDGTIYLEAETESYDAFLNKRPVPLSEVQSELRKLRELDTKLMDQRRAGEMFLRERPTLPSSAPPKSRTHFPPDGNPAAGSSKRRPRLSPG